MVGLCLTFIAFATTVYISFGDATQPVVTLNMEQGLSKVGLQLGYSLALLFTYPLMMFPAVSIIEVRCRFFFRVSLCLSSGAI